MTTIIVYNAPALYYILHVLFFIIVVKKLGAYLFVIAPLLHYKYIQFITPPPDDRQLSIGTMIFFIFH